MIITKEFLFNAAHKLDNYKGDCAKLHGHTYKLQIAVSGKVDKNGFVIDFKELKKIAEEKAVKELDHAYLNKFIKNPTAENISVWIWNRLSPYLDLYEIKLWETPSSFVTYCGK